MQAPHVEPEWACVPKPMGVAPSLRGYAAAQK